MANENANLLARAAEATFTVTVTVTAPGSTVTAIEKTTSSANGSVSFLEFLRILPALVFYILKWGFYGLILLVCLTAVFLAIGAVILGVYWGVVLASEKVPILWTRSVMRRRERRDRQRARAEETEPWNPKSETMEMGSRESMSGDTLYERN